jgi:hypothetical protein
LAAKRLATVSGVAIAPGVSRNGRLYTREAIGSAVTRAQARIQADQFPLTMRTHHKAEDDSVRIVGQVTSMWQDPNTGNGHYTADILDTDMGRSIANLLPESGDMAGKMAPLRGVSIRGLWAAEPTTIQHPEYGTVETAPDLEIDGLDFTASPGVRAANAVATPDDAQVPPVPPVPPTPAVPGGTESATHRWAITESAPEAVVRPVRAPYGEDVKYADESYSESKRFPLDTLEHCVESWRLLRQRPVTESYTAKQLKRVRERTVKALHGFGARVTNEGWLVSPEQNAITEYYDEIEFGRPPASYAIHLTNGPTRLKICSDLLDPHDLDAVGRTAMAAALAAILAIDPDLDADIDVGSDDGDGDALPPTIVVTDSAPQPQLAEAAPASVPTTQEAETAVTDAIPAAQAATQPTDQAAAPAAQVPVPASPTFDAAAFAQYQQYQQFLAMQAAAQAQPVAPAAPAPTQAAPVAPQPVPQPYAAPAVPVAPVQDSAPAAPVVETEQQRFDRAVQAATHATVQALIGAGQLNVERKGLVAPVQVGEAAPAGTIGAAAAVAQGLPQPSKPLHEMSQQEFNEYSAPMFRNWIKTAPRAGDNV